jgi:tetratricopeptide (TPR) repeat protein
MGINLEHLVFPRRLSPDYSGGVVDPTGGAADPWLWGGILLFAGSMSGLVFGARWRAYPGRAAVTMGAGVIAVSIFLVMNMGLTIGTIFADRLLYWPSLGWCLVLAGAATAVASTGTNQNLVPSAPRPATILLAGLLVLATAYGIRASRYLPAWKNDEMLFHEAVRASPRSPRAWFNLGQTLQNKGEFAQALNAYERATNLDPGLQQAWAMKATALMRMGRWDDARTPLDTALRLESADALSLLNQGVLWMRDGKLEEAEARFQEILKDFPESREALQNLAIAEASLGKPREAVATWRRYLEKEPDSPQALNNLAWLLATELGSPEDAIPLARRAVGLAPDDANNHDTLAEALRRAGRHEEALAEAREALRLESGDKYRRRVEERSPPDARSDP